LHLHVENPETLKEILMKLEDLTALTQAQTAQIAAMSAKADKIGSETLALLQKIADLAAAVANPDVPPALVAAFGDLKAAADVLGGKLLAVDESVPDAPPV
jgi:ABC-type nitrate/sulfonate/bicarbonate transport system substrate-binding protein